MPENDVSEETYVSQIKEMLTVEDITSRATKVCKMGFCMLLMDVNVSRVMWRDQYFNWVYLSKSHNIISRP